MENKYQEALGFIVDNCVPKIEVVNGIPQNKETECVLLLQELVDEKEPTKPIYHYQKGRQEHYWNCPKCNEVVRSKYWNGEWEEDNGKSNYCSECGQKLDWSDVNE